MYISQKKNFPKWCVCQSPKGASKSFVHELQSLGVWLFNSCIYSSIFRRFALKVTQPSFHFGFSSCCLMADFFNMCDRSPNVWLCLVSLQFCIFTENTYFDIFRKKCENPEEKSSKPNCQKTGIHFLFLSNYLTRFWIVSHYKAVGKCKIFLEIFEIAHSICHVFATLVLFWNPKRVAVEKQNVSPWGTPLVGNKNVAQI